MLWLGGITWVFMLAIPETLPALILTHKARRVRALKIPGYENVQSPMEATDRRLSSIFRVALTRPWKILIDPISLLVAIYVSVVYTLIYMLFTIFPIIFQEKRGWNTGVGELPLLGVVIGAGILIAISANDRKRQARGHVACAEDRLQGACPGATIFPIVMFWFAWSGEYDSVHWIVPTIAGVVLTSGILFIFVSFLNYLTDSYLMFAASALAANKVARSACAATAPLFTQYMFNALGVGGGGSLIAGIAVLLAPIPFVFYFKGGAIRRRSKFAPTPDHSKTQEKDVPEEQKAASSSDEESVVGSDSSRPHVESGAAVAPALVRPDDATSKDTGRAT